MIVVMIVIIPIMIGVPAVCIFVPPAMVVVPAVGAGFGKFVAPVFRLGTLPTVVLDGFVQLVVCLGGALLAVVGADNSRARKQNGACKQQGAEYKACALHFRSPMNYIVQFNCEARARTLA